MEREMEAMQLVEFRGWLLEDERERSTIEKYLRDVEMFFSWAGARKVTKELVARWKEYLQRTGHRPVTLNGKLSALNKFFSFLGWNECRVKYLKIQRRVFRNTEKELSREEYIRLVETARNLGRERLALLIETICATGIRVSEVRYITAEAVQTGRADIGNPAQFGCRWQGVYSQKVGSAAEALRGRLQPSSRNKRDFLRKRRSSFVSLAPT